MSVLSWSLAAAVYFWLLASSLGSMLNRPVSAPLVALW